MAVSVSSRSVQYTSGVQKRSGTGAVYNKSKAAGVVVDTADSYQLKYNKNGTVVTVIDSTNVATAGGATVAGTQKIVKMSLAGATWHTGNGTADYLSWTNPEAGTVIINRVIIYTTTKSSGAATADIGTTATDNHTSSDNLLDGVDIGTAAVVVDNFGTGGTNGKFLQSLATGKWVTFHALADPTGLVGNAYIYYTIA